eukprot:TRINITY_DN3039_c0_g1_i4.p1 TRINITY_DN3039_c0_g1~~TRINITY_DN3039_c0_g1_i4.p1  ORF type:complete len:240 (-),score=43.92 TRINITY_DN3039_c0_g1_i4:111-830(-)
MIHTQMIFCTKPNFSCFTSNPFRGLYRQDQVITSDGTLIRELPQDDREGGGGGRGSGDVNGVLGGVGCGTGGGGGDTMQNQAVSMRVNPLRPSSKNTVDGRPNFILESHRHVMLKWKSTFQRIVWDLFYAVPFVLGWSMSLSKQVLRTPIFDSFVYEPVSSSHGLAVQVTLSSPHLQLYSASMHFTANLSGLSYYCYYYFFTCFVVGTFFVMLCEIIFFSCCGLSLFVLLELRRKRLGH